MREPEPLPEPLDLGPFSTAEARRAGVRRGRLYRTDLKRPFHGIRSLGAGPDDDIRSRCDEYLPRLRPGQFFSHTTSAALHGLPLPRHLDPDPTVHVSSLAPGRAVRVAGARGHQLIPRPGMVRLLDGMPVASRIETWCQLGTLLSVDELIEAGDALLGRRVENVDAVAAALSAAIQSDDRPHIGRLRNAWREIRPGVRSPGETRLRLLLVRSGLPEPSINERILDSAGRFIAECDLVYRAARVVIEYEGDYHRTDVRVFRNDIVRRERLEDADWSVVRVTADDLAERPAETVGRIAARLAARGGRS